MRSSRPDKKIKRKLPERARPVTDPVQDARKRWGGEYTRTQQIDRWRQAASWCTTAQFAKTENGFRRHCGPTAITNLLIALQNRSGYLGGDRPPEEIFRQVAAIGRKRGIYWNLDLFGRFGGTYDLLTGRYLRECFRYFGVPFDFLASRRRPAEKHAGVRMYGRTAAGESEMAADLNRGCVLYIQLHKHPCYGDHHVLCYGYTVVAEKNGRHKKLYLRIADGWSAEPRYLAADDMLLAHYFAIR